MGQEYLIPADDRRDPPGCPDPDWCRGNRLCYWHCKARPDDVLELREEVARFARGTWGGL
jgi:hypothetical protein